MSLALSVEVEKTLRQPARYYQNTFAFVQFAVFTAKIITMQVRKSFAVG
jgi:hypothetical protein